MHVASIGNLDNQTKRPHLVHYIFSLFAHISLAALLTLPQNTKLPMPHVRQSQSLVDVFVLRSQISHEIRRGKKKQNPSKKEEKQWPKQWPIIWVKWNGSKQMKTLAGKASNITRFRSFFFIFCTSIELGQQIILNVSVYNFSKI